MQGLLFQNIQTASPLDHRWAITATQAPCWAASLTDPTLGFSPLQLKDCLAEDPPQVPAIQDNRVLVCTRTLPCNTAVWKFPEWPFATVHRDYF